MSVKGALRRRPAADGLALAPAAALACVVASAPALPAFAQGPPPAPEVIPAPQGSEDDDGAQRVEVHRVRSTSPPPASPAEDAQASAREDGEAPETDLDDVNRIEDLELEALLSGEFVKAVSRRVERADSAPAIVTVFTRAQIERWGYRTVDDILRHLYGFYVVDDHIVPNVAVRGISGGLRAESGLIQVTIDGVPVSYRPTGGRWLGPELIPMSAVERIEIVRGPASTVYGAGAFSGVINVVTRAPSQVDGGELRTEANYAGGIGAGADLTLARRIKDVGILVALRLHREDRSGLRVPATSPQPRIPDYRFLTSGTPRASALYLNSLVALTRLTLHLEPGHRLSLTGYASVLDRGAEFADWAQLTYGVDEVGRQRGNLVSLWNGYADLAYVGRFSSALTVQARARAIGGSPTNRDRIDIGSDVASVRRDSNFRGGAFEASAILSPSDVFTLTLGADSIIDDQQLFSTLNVPYEAAGTEPPGAVDASTSRRQGRFTFTNVGVFALASLEPAEALILHGGLRYDYNNIYESRLSGRLGTTLHILPELTLKVIYGTAFRAPTPQLLFGVPLASGDILGNRDLAPQQTHTGEAEIRFRPFEPLVVRSGVSYSIVLNKAEFTRQGFNLVARNLSEASVVTWDSDARLDWEEQLRAYASFSLALGRRNLALEGYRADLFRDDLEAYPPVMAHFGVNYRFVDLPLRFGTELSFISSRRASDNHILESAQVYHLPAAWYWDATASLTDLEFLPERNTAFTLLVRNLWGTDAPHPGFAGTIDYPSAPRMFILQVQQEI